MKTVIKTTAAMLLASTAIAHAGGIDRSGQSVDIIFEDGNYVELSFAVVDPNISGTDPAGNDTGDMALSYAAASGGFKMDISDKISAALIFDKPFGANLLYPAGSAFAGGSGDLNTNAITVVLSYDISDNFVAFGGIKSQSMEATATSAIPVGPFIGGYSISSDADTGFGYLVGAAYQIPEIALRVALTYHSGVTTTHNIVENSAVGLNSTSTLELTTPQSINLEAQTGVNEKTLVFGSVRWVNWSAFEIRPDDYETATGGPLISYANDTITYSLGVGRKLTDTLSAALTVGYEASLGGFASALGPTDGNLSVGAGISYTMDNAKFTFGAKYIWIGDAIVETHPAIPAPDSDFTGNTAVAFGFGISTSF